MSASAGANPQDAWVKGNTFYAQKQYDSAAFYFEQLAATKPADATVFYNLGNTYYRLNKVGLSVLAYERALKRRPGYKEARENLLLAQSRVPGSAPQAPADIFFVRWWKSITAPHLIMVWSVLSLLAFIALIGLLLYRRLQRGKVYIRPQITGALTLLWLTLLLLAFSSVYAALSNIHAVVVQDGAFVSGGKGGNSPVPEGTIVKITSGRSNGYEVALPDGRNGFIDKSVLQVID